MLKGEISVSKNMDTLYLPCVREQDTIEAALERLKQTDRRAVIVVSATSAGEKSYRLFKNEDIVDAWTQKLNLCSDIPADKGQEVNLLTDLGSPKQIPVMANIFMASSNMRDFLENAFQEYLDHHHEDFGILYPPDAGEGQTDVLVVTRSETLRDQILLAHKVCACSGPNRHTIKEPPDKHGKDCDFCPGKYSCW